MRPVRNRLRFILIIRSGTTESFRLIPTPNRGMGILPMISESNPMGGTPMLLFPNVAERRSRFV